jgi:hypothetical protein
MLGGRGEEIQRFEPERPRIGHDSFHQRPAQSAAAPGIGDGRGSQQSILSVDLQAGNADQLGLAFCNHEVRDRLGDTISGQMVTREQGLDRRKVRWRGRAEMHRIAGCRNHRLSGRSRVVAHGQQSGPQHEPGAAASGSGAAT